MRELNDLKKAERLEETRIAIAEGRVTVRQMTKAEHAEADARHDVREAARAARPARSGH
jgi:CMP-2-keto-3-deoxyoctulosonic acid synthetase